MGAPNLEAGRTAAIVAARNEADRIALTVAAPADVVAAARTHEALVTGETLATGVEYAEADTLAVTVTRS